MNKNIPGSTHHLNYSSSFNKLNPIPLSTNKLSKNNTLFRNPLQIKFDLNLNTENNYNSKYNNKNKINIKKDENEEEEDEDSIENYNPKSDRKNGDYMYSPNNSSGSLKSIESIEFNVGNRKEIQNINLNYNIENLINYEENITEPKEYTYNYKLIKKLMRMKNNWWNENEEEIEDDE